MKYSKNTLIKFDVCNSYSVITGCLWITGCSNQDLIFSKGDLIDCTILKSHGKIELIGQVLEDCEISIVGR